MNYVALSKLNVHQPPEVYITIKCAGCDYRYSNQRESRFIEYETIPAERADWVCSCGSHDFVRV